MRLRGKVEGPFLRFWGFLRYNHLLGYYLSLFDMLSQGLCDCVKKLLNSPIIVVPPAVAFTDLSCWGWPMLFTWRNFWFFLGYGTITKLTCSLEQRGSWWTCCESPLNQTLRPWRILQSRCLAWDVVVTCQSCDRSSSENYQFHSLQVAKTSEVSFQMSLWISGKLLPDWIKSATHATAWCVPRISG